MNCSNIGVELVQRSGNAVFLNSFGCSGTNQLLRLIVRPFLFSRLSKEASPNVRDRVPPKTDVIQYKRIEQYYLLIIENVTYFRSVQPPG